MDLNKKLIDQLSDLSRNIKSLTSEVKENKNAISAENSNVQKESVKEESGKKESIEDQNKKFLKSLEDIFKKGIGEITKKNSEPSAPAKKTPEEPKVKGLESALGSISPLKDKALESIVSNPKIPKGVSGLLGKIPKFASGGVMDKTGLALVGEKGPEVVKLDKGSEVISNTKSSELLKKETVPEKTVDQTLATQKGPTPRQIERYRRYLLGEYPDHYKEYPEFLDTDTKEWANSMRYHSPIVIHSLLEGKGENLPSIEEDETKLSQPANKIPEIKQEPEEISKRDQRKKEKEEKRKSKEENKKAEDLLKSEIKPQEEKEKSSLLDKGKSFLKEKGIGDKGKNLLFSKGKDILTGKTSLSDIAKNPSSLIGDKSQLLGKGMGAATSLLSNKGLREKAMDKLKGIKKEKEEEKSAISTESPELKKIQSKETNSEEVKEITKKEEKPKEQASVKKETVKAEESTPTKKESANLSSTAKVGKSESIGVTDLDDIKLLLGKIASLLEGPLSIETMDSPFRPDSRRF